jgi:OOP family OmpA-OmpF porin
MSTTRNRALRIASIAVLIAGLAGPVLAAEEDGGPYAIEVGLSAGAVLLDEDLAGEEGPSVAPSVALRLGGPFALRDFTWFADVLYSQTATETFRGDAESFTGRVGLEVPFAGTGRNPFFVSLAAGATKIAFDNATDFDSAVVSAGIGQWVALGGAHWMRWEYRIDHTLAEAGLGGQDLIQPQLLVGYHWRNGVRPRSRPERAPIEPGPAEVPAAAAAESAAPLPDGDGDGVPDADDLCPDTMKGVEVGSTGCPRDDDLDGVYDGLGMDKCPDTPAGAVVDRHGCPLDGDGDGVFDGLDRCPETPPGTEVDADGCAVE